MSLNKYMHPRNRYKIARPDFEALGQKYPEFKMLLTENAKGKPVLDFQNPEALRTLTTCMLNEDYGLKIELPPDRLVPTLPLRLNYVHWIEDMTEDWKKRELNAIDIGTGACCVYPILATSANPWRFLATEADEVNFSYAVRNMEENKLTKRIKVVKVSADAILEGVIGQTEDTYDFCMCNPPFFADHFEAQGLVSRSPSRPEAKTMSTASPQEGIVQGGEVGFVRRMIEESNFLQDRVRIYTTMLGKKASLAPLKEILRRYKITNFATTEFCQGKTMRWGLAWSFDKSVTFPKSAFSQGKKEGKKSLVHIIPTQVGERREKVYALVMFFKQIFSELKIHFREGKQTQFFALLTLTAADNTWIHTRRKRRQMEREAAAKCATVASESSSSDAAAAETGTSPSAAAQNADGTSGGQKNDHGSSSSDSVIKELSDSVKKENGSAAVKESPNSTKAVEELCDGAKNHDGSVAPLSKRTDTDNGELQEVVGIASALSTPSHTSTETENLKKKTEIVTADSSDSPPTKRAKLGSPAAPHDTSVDAEDDGMKAERDGAEASHCSSAKLVESSEPPLSEGDVSEVTDTAQTSCHTTPSGEGQVDSCTATTASEDGPGTKGKDRPPAHFILKCHMSVRVQGSDLAVELTWLDGQDIQCMHQLMQFFKNRLTQRKST